MLLNSRWLGALSKCVLIILWVMCCHALMQRGEKRLRHKELIIPIVVGTCAFYLGKKVRQFLHCIRKMTHPSLHKTKNQGYPQATETQSHRWNLYVRGINGDDISHVIKKVRRSATALRCMQMWNIFPYT